MLQSHYPSERTWAKSFHPCEISLRDKWENLQGIDNNQDEIILSPPSSLFIIKCMADRNYVSLNKFFNVWTHAQENEKLLNYVIYTAKPTEFSDEND